MISKATTLCSALALVALQAAQGSETLELKDLTKTEQQERSALSEKAKQVNVMPLALQIPSDEKNAKNLQLSELWDSTVARSQDIQFVVQKLVPPSQTNALLKLFRGVIYSGMDSRLTMAPNMGSQMSLTDPSLEPDYPIIARGQSLHPVGDPLNWKRDPEQSRKKALMSQEEAMILYNMVQSTAEKLVSTYEAYCEAMQEIGNDCDYVDDRIADARCYRSRLVDLAGEEAVTKIDHSNGFTKLTKAITTNSQ